MTTLQPEDPDIMDAEYIAAWKRGYEVGVWEAHDIVAPLLGDCYALTCLRELAETAEEETES